MLPALQHIFVYGTLKRGQCRESCWPVAPLEITAAWTRGHLFDLGPYPALLPGDDCVLGELWSFDAASIEPVLVELDLIEGTNQPGKTNLYNRETVNVTREDGLVVQASTYIYANARQARNLRKVPPTLEFLGQRCAVWLG